MGGRVYVREQFERTMHSEANALFSATVQLFVKRLCCDLLMRFIELSGAQVHARVLGLCAISDWIETECH